MTVYALACAFYSMIIEKVIKKYTAKRAFVGALLFYATAMAILGEW
jgi:solute carrier family 45, member 1/2/4